jgi:hypothetical protein
MTDGRLAAELAAIRRRFEDGGVEHGPADCGLNGETCTFHDAERMHAAIEAVLELHQPGPVLLLGTLCKNHAEYRFFSIDSTEQERVRACPDCHAVLRIHCTCGSGRFDRCRTRVAITSAILGELRHG